MGTQSTQNAIGSTEERNQTEGFMLLGFQAYNRAAVINVVGVAFLHGR